MSAAIRRSVLATCVAVFSACAAPAPHFHGFALPGNPSPDFTLKSNSAAPWTLSHQRGKVVAIFFGYTHCGDTCPATLAKLASALSKQGNGTAAEVAFVTVDPARDTSAVLDAYVRRFSGGAIVGLTGTPAQISRVEEAYHVWAQKIPGRRGNDDYDDSHSSSIYLVDRNGDQRVLHEATDSVDDFAADIRMLLQ